jgi:hypothetical protein
VATQRTSHRVASTPAEPKRAPIAERVRRVWRSRSGGRRSRPDRAGWEHLEALEARMDHLEAELEGLQDAVYRQAVRENENIGELRRRTEPSQLARDLSQDARSRGL